MLTFDIAGDDCAGPWTLGRMGWSSGGSNIAAYSHPALEVISVVDGRQFGLVVRETLGGRGGRTSTEPQKLRVPPEAFADRMAELADWPLDVLTVSVGPAAGGTVSLQAGRWGGAPLFLVAGRDRLHGHWDAARLYPHLTDAVDFGRLAYRLAYGGMPYSRRTLFPDMMTLTERSRAQWSPSAGLRVDYPAGLPWSRASLTVPDADVLGMFETLMTASLRRWFDPAQDRLAAQLSGGLDSGAVAMMAARLSDRPLRTYGLIMPGRTGEYQRQRRDEILAACGAIDTAVDSWDYAPFSRGERGEDDATIPWSEYYHEAFRTLLAYAHGDDCSMILTGTGGDEISARQWGEPDERPPRPEPDLPDFLTETALEACRAIKTDLDPAPRGIAPRSYYEAARAGAVVYLRAGVWPLYPYATPELVEFCRCLPAEWRRDRALQRRWLQKQGLSQAVWRPERPENFLGLLDLGLQQQGRPLILSLLAQSRLVSLGLVSRERCLAAYERYCKTDAYEEGFAILQVVVLELAFRAIERARRQARA